MKSGCGCGVRALDGMTRGPRDGTRGQRRAHFTRGLSARVTCQIVTFACAPTAPTILHLLGLVKPYGTLHRTTACGCVDSHEPGDSTPKYQGTRS